MTSGVKSNPPSLKHLLNLTTEFGIIQHAIKDVPDPRFGYSIDDSARALIACLWYSEEYGEKEVSKLIPTYFKFLQRAQTDTGEFHNFFDINGKPLDKAGSADSFGRTVWAIGELLASPIDLKIKREAQVVWDRSAFAKHHQHTHLRTISYILLAQCAVKDKGQVEFWAKKLVELFEVNSSDDWLWFEGSLRYCNATPVYALTRAYGVTGNKKFLEVAEKAFVWLDKVSRVDGVVAPIGQDGWYHKSNDKAVYDQQPVDAAKMVIAAVQLSRTTNKEEFTNISQDWFDWYFGNNTKKITVYNKVTGGIYDGVTPKGVNENQGAESIVTYLMAYVKLSQLIKDR